MIQRLDKTLGPKVKSLVIPAEMNNDGSLSKNNNALAGNQIDELRKYSRVKMRQLAASILDGEIRPAPSRRSGKTACTFCDYGDICHFNARERGMEFNEREKREEAQKWSVIRNAIHSEGECAEETGGAENG